MPWKYKQWPNQTYVERISASHFICLDANELLIKRFAAPGSRNAATIIDTVSYTPKVKCVYDKVAVNAAHMC